MEGMYFMRERGHTIEFSKEFYKRIGIAARLEGKTILQFATNVLDKKITEVEQSFARSVISKNNHLANNEGDNNA